MTSAQAEGHALAADDDVQNTTSTENEPLLGGPGDAIQKPDAPIVNNLYLGTGWLALIGLALLLAIVWSAVFTHPRFPLVSPHPLLQSLGTATLTLAILILQPTSPSNPQAKLLGAKLHAGLQLLSLALFIAGVAVIETNKHVSHGEHFHSAHGFLGVLTAVLFVVQYVVGVLMWKVPTVFGSEEKAKAVWKYHRFSGYVLLGSVLATVVSAAETDYVKGRLGVKTWAVAAAAVLVVVGVFPRLQLSKLGVRH